MELPSLFWCSSLYSSGEAFHKILECILWEFVSIQTKEHLRGQILEDLACKGIPIHPKSVC